MVDHEEAVEFQELLSQLFALPNQHLRPQRSTTP